MNNIPLAERMRPNKLDDFVGQQHVIGPKSSIMTSLKQKRLPSIILWGPPGVGKTTLAKLLSEAVGMPLTSLSAISSGVKDIRETISRSEKDRLFHPNGRVLFIDEIHRFSKSQQDSLLAAVEKGVVTLIGATTENPSFEINSALMSRCQLHILKKLSLKDLQLIGKRAMSEDSQMLKLEIKLIDWEALYGFVGGDGRRFLNTLESLSNTCYSEGISIIDSSYILENAPKISPIYDRAGEQHYDISSALIKSIRGSHPQAALYWLARMIKGGESPTYIARRLLISASEDIGLANPNALHVANACYQSVECLGMPEGRIPLAQCVIYLSSCPKSNSTLIGIDAAMEIVEKYGDLDIPLHLRNAPSEMMKEIGYGKSYKHPHDYPGNFVNQKYLPDDILNSKFYCPGDNEVEKKIRDWLDFRWGDMK